MASTSEVPAWLQGSNNKNTTNDDAANAAANDAEMGNNMTAVDIEPTPADTAAAKNNNENDIASTEQTSTCSKVMKCIILSISAFLFVLFVASSVVQDNDTGATAFVYLIFYALHAIVAGAYFFSHFMCKSIFTRIVTGLGGGMLVWSIVLVVISSIDYSKTSAEDDVTDAGGDNPNATKKEEIAYEIAGAALGAISSIYHVCMARRSK